MSSHLAPIGHNLGPPLVPPSEKDFLADLEAQYPTVQKDLKECLDAAKTYPDRIIDDETAGALQALIKKMRDTKAAWKAWRGVAKKPWDTIAKIAHNFFVQPEEQLGEQIEKLQPRYTAFLELKAERQRQEREAAAEREREAAEELRMDQLWAEARAELAQYDERKAREREEAARRAEEEARQRQAEAERKAKAAAEEAQRLEREKRERENAERSENTNIIRQMKALMKDAGRLADIGYDLLEPNQSEAFADLVLEGGEISRLGGKLLRSTLLDEEQKTFVDESRSKLLEWRAAHAKHEKEVEEREVARRKAIREEQERQAAAEAAEREKQRKEEEARIAAARAQREAAEREVEEAQARARTAKVDVREARGDAREAIAGQKTAAREATTVGRQADRVEARADRMDRRLEGASDADMSRTRGEYGTVGSLATRWTYVVEDRDKLVPYFGPLGMYLHPDAMDAAVYRYMQANQGQWNELSLRTEVPGVFFEKVPEARIK